MNRLGIALLLLGCGCAADDFDDVPDAAWPSGKADGSSHIYVSASSVEALNGDLSSLNPACRTADSFHSCEDYLSTASALGDYGPIGAYGPLGSLGPLGSNSWNASAWMSGAGDWSSWSDK